MIATRRERIALAMRALREDRGLTLEEAAERIGMSSSNLSRWERGRRTPRADRLWDFLSGLGFDFGDLDRAIEKMKTPRRKPQSSGELLDELRSLRDLDRGAQGA